MRIYGVPSGRTLKRIPVFNVDPMSGWGICNESKKILGTKPDGSLKFMTGDMHHVHGSYLDGTYDGKMFTLLLRPERQRRIVAVYTQDMGKAQWEQPADNWIDARQAFYVSGSKKMGSMGPTLAAFALEADARAFARTHGGKVMKFAEITPDMAILDGGVLRDEKP